MLASKVEPEIAQWGSVDASSLSEDPFHLVSLKQNDYKAFVFFQENFTFSSIDLDINVVSFMIWDKGKDLVCSKQEWQKDKV